MSEPVLGGSAPAWVAGLAALLAGVTAVESWLGHFRSGFPLHAQYAPLGTAAALVLAAGMAIVVDSAWARAALGGVGWLAVATGAVGVAYHHYYGIVRRAGGYRWLLHHLLYGAPPLAPLALSAAGALGVVAAHGLAGSTTVAGVELGRVLLAVVALALAGAAGQAGILHYRGAFNTPAMYAPLLVPPLAAVGAGWLAIAPSPGVAAMTRIALWATFLLGFVGLGFHLRGLDRQMGGLHVFRFNLLQGPPPLAPALFVALAAVGLLGLGMA